MTNELGTTLQYIEAKAERKREALVALDTLSCIAHLNLHGNVETSQLKCIDEIRKYIEEN